MPGNMLNSMLSALNQTRLGQTQRASKTAKSHVQTVRSKLDPLLHQTKSPHLRHISINLPSPARRIVVAASDSERVPRIVTVDLEDGTHA